MPKTAPKPQLTAITALNPWCWALSRRTSTTGWLSVLIMGQWYFTEPAVLPRVSPLDALTCRPG
jgi:hypothetical protein